MDFTDLMATVDQTIQGSALAGPITYTPGVGVAVSVRGIFTAPYTPVDIGEGRGVASVQPTLFLVVADIPSDPTTDSAARVTVAGDVYRWDTGHTEPDGMGGIVLFMHKVVP